MPLGTLGKYERLDVLGHGASGIVYLAKDTFLGRLVALKEVAAHDAGERERVLAEARVLDRLRHPHIVQVYGVDEIDGKVVIAMEYVRGRSLLDVLRHTPQLPVFDAIRIAAQICEGLAFAHAQRTVHRDIKPANILVCEDGTVKLVDFGLAEVLGTHSIAGGAGTYAYMAPETFGSQSRSGQSGRASDIWAAGVVLWEMLAGRRPFSVANAKDPFVWKAAISEGVVPAISTLRPDAPAALDSILTRALSRDPAARYADADAMAVDLWGMAPLASNSGQGEPASSPCNGISSAAETGLRSGRTTAWNSTGAAQWDAADTPTVAQGAQGVSLPGFLGVTDIDAFLVQAPDEWAAACATLLDRTLSHWLLSIGEEPLAEVANSLANETSRKPDDRLRDFLYRAGLDTITEARRAYSEGQRLLKAGRASDAVPLLERAVRLHSLPAAYHRALAEALRPAASASTEAPTPSDMAGRQTAVREGVIALSTNAVDFGALRIGQSRSARIVLRNSRKGVLQGRVVSAPGWVRVEPAAFATRHRQPLTLTAYAAGVWPQEGAKLTDSILCRDVLIIETDGGVRQEVALAATVLPARRGLVQVGLWYMPLLVCCVLPALAGLSAPHTIGHAAHARHLWEPGLLAGGLLAASLFALTSAADTVISLRLLPLVLLALLGGGFFGSVGNIDMTHALKAALVQTSVPMLVMLVLQTITLAVDPRGWGRWQLWRWIAGATGLLATYVLWHSG